MDGLSGVPTYTPDTTKEKFEKELIGTWPKIYRLINGSFYFLIKTLRDIIIRSIQMIFNK